MMVILTHDVDSDDHGSHVDQHKLVTATVMVTNAVLAMDSDCHRDDDQPLQWR